MFMKKLAAAAFAALLLWMPTHVDAKSFETQASVEPMAMDFKIGENAEFLRARAHFNTKHVMMDRCAAAYVMPYFMNKGIELSQAEANAIAFGALHLSDIQEILTPTEVGLSAKGTISDEYILDIVYGDKKWMQAYMETREAMNQLSRDAIPAEKSYYQYKDPASAEILQQINDRKVPLFIRLQRLEAYQNPAVGLVLTGDDVNFRSQPSTDSQVLDSLSKGEQLCPIMEKDEYGANTCRAFEANGRKWYKAINAKGQLGYVAAEFIRVAC